MIVVPFRQSIFQWMFHQLFIILSSSLATITGLFFLIKGTMFHNCFLPTILFQILYKYNEQQMSFRPFSSVLNVFVLHKCILYFYSSLSTSQSMHKYLPQLFASPLLVGFPKSLCFNTDFPSLLQSDGFCFVNIMAAAWQWWKNVLLTCGIGCFHCQFRENNTVAIQLF